MFLDKILPTQQPNLDQYFCNSRLRIDTWNRLKDNVGLLQALPPASSEPCKLITAVEGDLQLLKPIEKYWAFPGNEVFQSIVAAFHTQQWSLLEKSVTVIARLISTDHYRSHDWMSVWENTFLPNDNKLNFDDLSANPLQEEPRPYFEVLVIDSLAIDPEHQIRQHQTKLRRAEDSYIYNVVVVSNFEDAIIATLLNYNIQACIVRYTFPFTSENQLTIIDKHLQLAGYSRAELKLMSAIDRSGALGEVLQTIRPELDLYLFSEASVEKVTSELHHQFRRCFFGSEDYAEMHLTLLKGIEERFETPFFNALKKYTLQPTGVFHAMPISRGKSISKSHWIRDYGDFYGDRMFLSETSATTGGLDSLLQPSGSIKKAQSLAARAFGADKTLFVSNGTSTANKIVLQAVTKPGDIVLLSNDCHQSHHFGAVLADVRPVYLNPFSLDQYSICGAVSLRDIKLRLLELKRNGKLNRVRALLLTNLTFDGIAYNLEYFMTECLAIKPDLIFLWDEAWFAYGYFTPVTRERSAMHTANKLKAKFSTAAYREEYDKWHKDFSIKSNQDDNISLDSRLLPDPEKVRVRVYSTQSTHKTLTALRQASMIHINDEEFTREVETSMRDAYLTHTSTSPNYQILASLDISRRQMELEGYELVQKSFELSMILRDRINNQKPLSNYFRALDSADLIPEAYQSAGQHHFQNKKYDNEAIEGTWGAQGEFALDPSRITLDLSRTGIDGDTFRQLLMDRFDIQVNKTSRNTLLLIIHIGSTRGMISYLVESLTQISRELEQKKERSTKEQLQAQQHRVEALTNHLPPLPTFTQFHDAFRDDQCPPSPDGNLRKAFYEAQKHGATTFIFPTEALAKELDDGRELVSAAFITPYPPGYPVLVPGQLISPDTIRFLLASTRGDIHGYDRKVGLPLFSKSALTALTN